MKCFLKFLFLLLILNSVSCLNKEKDCKCRILPESKIVGGKQAHHLAYPWIASISDKSDERLWPFKNIIKDDYKINHHVCGATIINEKWVMTSATCLPDKEKRSYYVGFGNDNDLVKIFDSRRIKSFKVLTHPNFFIQPKISNDIALIELIEPLKFDKDVKPACFLNKNEELYTGVLDHPGWGSTEIFKTNPQTKDSTKIKLPRYLQKIFLIDQSDTYIECKQNEDVICGKGIEEGESSCKGDAGSPIHYTKNGKSYVVGITSYSKPIIKDGYYNYCINTTVYTRVTNFISWIKSHVGKEICDF